MNRRNLFGATLALIATLGLAGCKEEKAASEQAAAKPAETFHWKMVTSWPKNFPGVGVGAERFATLVNEMSEQVHVVSRVVRSVILIDDAEKIEAEFVKINKARDRYNAAEAALDKLPASEKGLAIRAKIKAARDEARAAHDARDRSVSYADGLPSGTVVIFEGIVRSAIDENIARSGRRRSRSRR